MKNLKYIKYLTILLSLLLLINLYFNFYTMSSTHTLIFLTFFISSSFYLKIIELEYDIELLKQHVLFLENDTKENDNE